MQSDHENIKKSCVKRMTRRLSTVAISTLAGFSMLAPGMANAQSSCMENRPTLTVTGQAEVTQAAKTVEIHSYFRERSSDSKSATGALNKRFNTLLESIKVDLPDSVTLEADQIRINPQFSYNNSRRYIDHYTASRSLKLRDVPVEKAGKWVEVLSDANPSRLSLNNYKAGGDSTQNTALRLAVENARDKAQAMGEALDQPIGPAVCIDETRSPRVQRRMMNDVAESLSASAKSNTPSVEAGQVSDSARVEVVFALVEPER